MSVRLYVGNLPKEQVEKDSLAAIFVDEGENVSTKVIKDRKTGKCRGFAFVTVPSDEIAEQFIAKYNGQSFMDSPMKIEKAQPRAKTEDGGEGEGGSSAAAPGNKRKGGNGNKQRARKQQPGSGNRQDSIQPDPRWADQLSKLKEMLAASNN